MLIGSIKAWLPSRKSTDVHMGALVMVLSGQVRWVIFGANAKGWYFYD